MSLFSRLAIGTAAWAKEYNGHKVSADDQRKILQYCDQVGINTIHTCRFYGSEEILRLLVPGICLPDTMKIISKGHGDTFKESCEALGRKPDAYLTNSDDVIWEPFYDEIGGDCLLGASIYELETAKDLIAENGPVPDIICVPYSLFDRRFELYFEKFKQENIEIHVRSIFLRGRILEKATPAECIDFCLMNPYVDKVIIGVDSYDQLRQNLEHLERFESLKIDDENILDPRRWQQK